MHSLFTEEDGWTCETWGDDGSCQLFGSPLDEKLPGCTSNLWVKKFQAFYGRGSRNYVRRYIAQIRVDEQFHHELLYVSGIVIRRMPQISEGNDILPNSRKETFNNIEFYLKNDALFPDEYEYDTVEVEHYRRKQFKDPGHIVNSMGCLPVAVRYAKQLRDDIEHKINVGYYLRVPESFFGRWSQFSREVASSFSRLIFP